MSARAVARAARRGAGWVLAAGALALVLAVTWWGLIFGLMIEAGVLTVREAGWCMGDTSGLCRALATLCTADHPLGLKTYSPELFWASLCLLAAGAFGRLLALFFTPTLASLPTLRFRSWR